MTATKYNCRIGKIKPKGNLQIVPPRNDFYDQTRKNFCKSIDEDKTLAVVFATLDRGGVVTNIGISHSGTISRAQIMGLCELIKDDMKDYFNEC